MIKKTSLLLAFILFSSASLILHAEIHTIEDNFDGCNYGKIYPLTNGQYLRCNTYKYFHTYRPKVIADGRKVLTIDEREVKGEIVDGMTIRTQIDGDWEGCNFDVHRLMNGMHLVCSTYFYEYAYMPFVKILVINGAIEAVLINGKSKHGISVQH